MIFEFFKKHKIGILLAILTGIIFVFPQFHYRWKLGDEYRGIFRAINDDEPYYMTRAQDIKDGHYLLSNSLLYEHKKGLSMQFFLPDLILAFPARIFDINVYSLYLFYDFLLPTFGIFLTYLIFYELMKNRGWSLLFSSFLYLIQYLFIFNRPVSPQFNFLFVLTFVFLLLKIYKQQGMRTHYWVLALMNFGVIFYIYTYYWTYLSLFLFFLIAFFLVKKDKRLLGVTTKIFFFGPIIALPYFYQTLEASSLPVFQESITRLGMLDTRIPSGIQIVVPAMFVLTWYIWHYRKNLKNIDTLGLFMISGLLSGIFSVNQHLVTGKNLYFSSHYELISYFFIAFSLAFIISKQKIFLFLQRKKIILVFGLFTALMFFNKFFPLLQLNKEKEITRQQLAQLFEWFNVNTANDSVVFSDDAISGNITSYTHNNVFYDTDALLYFMSDEEIVERFLLINFWQEDFNGEFIKDKFHALFGFQYDAQAGRQKQLNKIRSLLGRPQEDLDQWYFPQKNIGDILDEYKAIQGDNWKERISQYRVDYVVVEEQNPLNIPDELLNSLTKVADLEKYTIYEFN